MLRERWPGALRRTQQWPQRELQWQHSSYRESESRFATDGVERVELTEPRKALDAADARTIVVSPKTGSIKGWEHDHWGESITVEGRPVRAELLRGGETGRGDLSRAVDVARGRRREGRTITSWPSLRTDIGNAGGDWVDREVVTDQGLVTSRKPDDIPVFNRKMIEEFAEGVHEAQSTSARRQKGTTGQVEAR